MKRWNKIGIKLEPNSSKSEENFKQKGSNSGSKLEKNWIKSGAKFM